VRLAFVEAGSDWRSLNRLRVLDGKLADYLIIPEDWYAGILGVTPWEHPACTVTGRAACTTGAFAVADPRLDGIHFNNIYRIVKWDRPSHAITGGPHVASGLLSVADPRPPAGPCFGKYAITRWNGPAGTVIGGDDSGAYAVADPRLKMRREKGADYRTAGHYGVIPWTSPSGAISGAAGHDNGRFNVADPRLDSLPAANAKMVAIIRALDGTWHRPFTTLELAALQSLIDPDNLIDLDGASDGAKRERIGNAVPAQAAQAIADLMGQTLLLAWSGESFALSAQPIWVQPIAIALSVKGASG